MMRNLKALAFISLPVSAFVVMLLLLPASAVEGRMLSESQKSICQQNQASIQNIFTKIYQNSESYYNRLGDIQVKLEGYIAANNLNVANYTSLQEKVNTARNAVREALRQATQTSSQFGCDKEDPKGVVNQYKTQIQSATNNMKAYRDSLKELLNATKTAAESRS